MTDALSKNKISVIMLTYNREEFVERAINSIKQQTFDEFEYIIVDNGSTDTSGLIADACAEDDPRIEVLHIEKTSIAKGRNIGLEASIGEYIAFIDDDDYAEEDMLEFLYKLAFDNEADIALCGSTKQINEKILPNFVYDDFLVMNSEQAVVEMLKREKYNVALPTKIVKRDLFNEIKFIDKTTYDDIWVGYKLFAISEKTVAHGIPKYCFCHHGKNISSFTTNDALLTDSQLDEYLKAFRQRTLYLSEKLPKINDYALYSEFSYMISMCNKIISNNLVHCEKKLHHMKKILSENYDWFYDCPHTKDFEREYMLKYIR